MQGSERERVDQSRVVPADDILPQVEHELCYAMISQGGDQRIGLEERFTYLGCTCLRAGDRQ